ncbi:MAG: type IX secretion system membrane protein PorP/SprF [Flavobacteriales bacterium]|nr:type IX secretion system membrane protein PorP/SprF [Flavobacteriales bacterium]
MKAHAPRPPWLRAASHEPQACLTCRQARGSKPACGSQIAPCHPLFSQDVHFSQFFTAPLVLNPANAGDIEGDQRAALMHRSQWQSAGSPFRTYAMSYDVPLFRGRMRGRYLGIGMHGFSDRAGSTRFGDTQGASAYRTHCAVVNAHCSPSDYKVATDSVAPC